MLLLQCILSLFDSRILGGHEFPTVISLSSLSLPHLRHCVVLWSSTFQSRGCWSHPALCGGPWWLRVLLLALQLFFKHPLNMHKHIIGGWLSFHRFWSFQSSQLVVDQIWPSVIHLFLRLRLDGHSMSSLSCLYARWLRLRFCSASLLVFLACLFTLGTPQEA